MSSPPKSDHDFNWGEVAPDGIEPTQKDHLARQVRIMRAAGKGMREISSWLQQNGLSPEQTEGIVAELSASGQADWWERFCGRASLALIAVLSAVVLVLVVVQRPWDADRWSWQSGASEIDAVAGFVLFCFLYCAAMSVLWFLAMRFGALLDLIRAKYRG